MDDNYDNNDNSTPENEAELGRRGNGLKSPSNQPLTKSIPEPEAITSNGVHVISNDETENMDTRYGIEGQYMDYQNLENQNQNWRSESEIIKFPTEDNESFPSDFPNIQEGCETFETKCFSHIFSKSEPSPPRSYAHAEFSFSRRVHRTTLERVLSLLTSTDHLKEQRKRSVFGFALMYYSTEDLEGCVRTSLSASTKDSLQNWHSPFLHIGGSGTHYPSQDNWEPPPKFSAGYSMGPFPPAATHAKEFLTENMECTLHGFKGCFFDANDVEGYLKARGLDIPPTADFVAVDLDTLGIYEILNLETKAKYDLNYATAPKALRNSEESTPLSVENDLSSKGVIDIGFKSLVLNSGLPDWEDFSSMEASCNSSTSSFITHATPNVTANCIKSTTEIPKRNKRIVNIDVNMLLYGVLLPYSNFLTAN